MQGKVPPGADQDCKPTPLPDRDLSAAEVFDALARDQIEIQTCDQRRRAAVGAIKGAAAP